MLADWMQRLVVAHVVVDSEVGAARVVRSVRAAMRVPLRAATATAVQHAFSLRRAAARGV